MALNQTGPISWADINRELGRPTRTKLSLSDSAVSVLFSTSSGKAGVSPSFKLSTGRGQSVTPTGYIFNAVIAANAALYNIKAAAISAGWNGITPLLATITINTSITVGAAAITPALDTGVTFPTGSQLTLINYGKIYGQAGTGGNGGSTNNGAGGPGGPGGPALTAQYPLTIYNYGTIAGGGGGGGGNGGAKKSTGAAGGAGAGFVSLGSILDIPGTRGGALGAAGTNGTASGGAGGLGGAGGFCTTAGSNTFIAWAVTGTRAGALG